MGIGEWFRSFAARIREYFIDEFAVGEWLPWGGIVRDNVVKNKDGSFLGIVEYEAVASSTIPAIDFPKGWALWSEQQHVEEKDRFFLVVCWNPFFGALDHDDIENALLGRSVRRGQAADYFVEELSRLADNLRSGGSTCRILEYQEILDFLSFSLSVGKTHVDMPEVPLYLDVLLSEPIHAEFEENGLSVCDSSLVVLTFPAFPRGALLDEIRHIFSGIPFRYVRRLLAMTQAEAEAEWKVYTKNWCRHRGYIKRAVLDGILSPMSGYADEHMIFLLAPDIHEKAVFYLRSRMDALGLPYILENYNAKDVWWGSLAGCFRANIRPILFGFRSFTDFLIAPQRGGGHV